MFTFFAAKFQLFSWNNSEESCLPFIREEKKNPQEITNIVYIFGRENSNAFVNYCSMHWIFEGYFNAVFHRMHLSINTKNRKQENPALNLRCKNRHYCSTYVWHDYHRVQLVAYRTNVLFLCWMSKQSGCILAGGIHWQWWLRSTPPCWPVWCPQY